MENRLDAVTADPPLGVGLPLASAVPASPISQ